MECCQKKPRFLLPSTMSMQIAGDIPLLVTSENSSSERRVTPSWTIGQFKAKLEPVTGIPPLSQKLTLRVPGQQGLPVEAADEENTQLNVFPLAPYAELHVSLSCIRIAWSRETRCIVDRFSLRSEVRRLKEQVLKFCRWLILGPLVPVLISRMPRAWRNM
jgi:hypothetical protein